MTKLEELATLMCPDLKHNKDYYEKLYKERELAEGAIVTRFAPSPTGFLHTGSLFATFVSSKIAHDSNGVFFLRIEDTDTKREVKGSVETLISQLQRFNIKIDEGYELGGNYGPYLQSARSDIYNAVIYDMVCKGQAYPCFCSSEQLDEVRKQQSALKERPGYYGKYATCRNIDVETAILRIKNGEPYVVRLKSKGSHENHINFYDEIRGELLLSENDMDIVIRKSDGLPTYHFAHACDDHFMRTTHVIRGEEWLSSVPIHVELFNTLGFELPKYAHVPDIMKIDEGRKRKLSKRYDKEASVDYFTQEGYPTNALLIYLCTIANSNFEEWRLANPNASLDEFKLSFNKFSLDGALFDMEKINNISKDVIYRMNSDELLDSVLSWANEYDLKLAKLILDDKDKFVTIMSLGKDDVQPRKDYIKYSDIFDHICYMYNAEYDKIVKEELPYDKELISKVCLNFKEDLQSGVEINKDEYFAHLKEIARPLGFAYNKKDLKENNFQYMFGDYMSIVRVALTGRKNSFDLVDIINIIGKEETIRRLNTLI